MISKREVSTLLPVYAAAVTVFGSMIAAVPAQADGGDQGGAVLNQINATRAANGCGPVAANPQLTAAKRRTRRGRLLGYRLRRYPSCCGHGVDEQPWPPRDHC